MTRPGGLLTVAVVGAISSTALAAPTLLEIDSVELPGISFVLTFEPRTRADGGVKLIAAKERVRTTAVIRFDEVLPVVWMATVTQTGDVAPNQMAHGISTADDSFVLSYSQQISIAYRNGEWHLPNYDSRAFTVEVGFGFRSDVLNFAYSVMCRPGEVLPMLPGAYQVVRSDGDNRLGAPIPDGEHWSLPIGSRSRLTMDASGFGTLAPLP